MNNCVFCKIAKKEVPADIVYEDEKFLAFLDINPVNPGHTLLIPKNHYENIYKIPEEILSGIAPLLKKISIAVKNAAASEGINIMMNNESAAGQIVPHAHFHIIPRFSNDGFRHWKGQSYPSEKDRRNMAEKIKSNIKY